MCIPNWTTYIRFYFVCPPFYCHLPGSEKKMSFLLSFLGKLNENEKGLLSFLKKELFAE